MIFKYLIANFVRRGVNLCQTGCTFYKVTLILTLLCLHLFHTQVKVFVFEVHTCTVIKTEALGETKNTSH